MFKKAFASYSYIRYLPGICALLCSNLTATLWADQAVAKRHPIDGPIADRKLALKHAQQESEDLQALIQSYKQLSPKQSMSLALDFLDRWPQSVMADSARLIAAQSAILNLEDEKALNLLSQVRGEDLLKQVLPEKLYLLVQLKKYDQALEQGTRAQQEAMPQARQAMCQFYLAQALYLPVKDKPLSDLNDADKQKLKQALALFTSAQASVGYQAALSCAQVAYMLGNEAVAAKNFLAASEKSGADSAMCLYQGASLLAKTQKKQAQEIAWQLSHQPGQWQQPASLLWLSITVDLNQAQEVLAQKSVLDSAYAYDLLKTLSLHARAYKLANQLQAASGLLKTLVEKSLDKPESGLIESSFKSLTLLLASLEDLSGLQKYSKLYSQKKARDGLYFDAVYLLAQLQEDQEMWEHALQSYSTIVVQNPRFEHIDYCLLKKGILEAKLGRLAASWSTLDLYLQKHSSPEGSLKAWPVFLRDSLRLRYYSESKSLNEDRFALVLDRLQAATIDPKYKQQWIYDLASGLAKSGNHAEAGAFLGQIQLRYSHMMSSPSQLLLAISQVRQDQQAKAFINKAVAIIASAPLLEKVSLQQIYFEELMALAGELTDEKEEIWSCAGEVLWQIFNAQPHLIPSEHMLWLAERYEQSVQAPPAPPIWQAYMVDDIYDMIGCHFNPIELGQASRDLAKRAVNLLSYAQMQLKSENKAKACLLNTRLQWLLGDYKSAVQSAQTALSESTDARVIRQALAYASAAYGLDGQSGACYDFGQKLLARMQEDKADESLYISMKLGLTRHAIVSAHDHSKQAQDYQSKALASLKDIEKQKTDICNVPLYLEAAIDRAHLTAATSSSKDGDILLRELLAVKRCYFEPLDDEKSQIEVKEHSEQSAGYYQAYALILDAMIAQQELSRFEKGQSDYMDQLLLCKNLYTTLQAPKYACTPFIKQQTSSGVEALKQIE